MLIVCPNCSTAYRIQPDTLGAGGRAVRCASCKQAWFATPASMVEEAMMAAPAAAPARAAPPAAQPPAQDDFGADFSADASQDAGQHAMGGEQALAETDAPPLAPGDEHADVPAATKFDPGAPDEPEAGTIQRARKTSKVMKEKRTVLQRILSLPTLIVVLAVALFAIVQGRTTVVRHFPQTGSLFAALGMPVNLRGLVFKEVVSKAEFHEGAMVLVVEGVIANLTPRTLDVPRLRFSLRNAAGHEVYAWTALPTRPQLGSGDGLAFRTRLASPPADGRDVIVRFFNRRDAALGTP
jgi:predicted Zn finger-like uncharacterized protein